MRLEHVVKSIYAVHVDPADYEQDRQNPLFINQRTGQFVFKSCFYIKKPSEEITQCAKCGQSQTKQTWQSVRNLITRTLCGCPISLTIIPVNDHDY